MSREIVIDVRARALFNKFWGTVTQDPQWMRDVFQNNPDVFDRLLKAFSSSNPAGEFAQVVSAVRQIALQQAKERATIQVDALSPDLLNWVQETLEHS